MFGWRIKDREPTWEKEGKNWEVKTTWKSNEYVLEQIKPFTVSWLATFLDTSRETLMDYQEKDEFSDTIKRAKQRIYAYTEESLFTKWSATWAIFSLKNNYWWVDKSEVDSKTEHSFPELSQEQMKKIAGQALK